MVAAAPDVPALLQSCAAGQGARLCGGSSGHRQEPRPRNSHRGAQCPHLPQKGNLRNPDSVQIKDSQLLRCPPMPLLLPEPGKPKPTDTVLS